MDFVFARVRTAYSDRKSQGAFHLRDPNQNRGSSRVRNRGEKDQDPDDLPNDNLDDELDDRLDHLARQFMDLWREQVAATADGADAASAIGRLYASLGADTSRIGEGFEAWGKLIGQLATGQKPGLFPVLFRGLCRVGSLE